MALSFGDPRNKEKTFQGQRFDDNLGLNWIQFKWRNHDPQIGRFVEIDPLSEQYVYNSTYAFSENKVVAHRELEGLETVPINGVYSPVTGGYLIQGDVNGDMVVDKSEREAWFKATSLWVAGGASLLTGGRVGPGLLLRFGGIGAAVNVTFSALEGESGYQIFKAAISGFVGGAVLGALGTSSTFTSILAAGFASGAAGEATSQAVDNIFGNRNDFDLGEIAKSGAIGAIANVISNAVVNKVNQFLDQKLSTQIVSTNTAAYRETIKKAIKQESPNIGTRALSKAINQRIKEAQKLLQKQNQLEKAAVKQAVERSIDYIQNQVNKSTQ